MFGSRSFYRCKHRAETAVSCGKSGVFAHRKPEETSRLASGGAVYDFYPCGNRRAAARRLVQRPAGRRHRHPPRGNHPAPAGAGAAPAKPVRAQLPPHPGRIFPAAGSGVCLCGGQTIPRRRPGADPPPGNRVRRVVPLALWRRCVSSVSRCRTGCTGVFAVLRPAPQGGRECAGRHPDGGIPLYRKYGLCPVLRYPGKRGAVCRRGAAHLPVGKPAVRPDALCPLHRRGAAGTGAGNGDSPKATEGKIHHRRLSRRAGQVRVPGRDSAA